jgi:hypothetical protein
MRLITHLKKLNAEFDEGIRILKQCQIEDLFWPKTNQSKTPAFETKLGMQF